MEKRDNLLIFCLMCANIGLQICPYLLSDSTLIRDMLVGLMDELHRPNPKRHDQGEGVTQVAVACPIFG
jgi:hypothetical protein